MVNMSRNATARGGCIHSGESDKTRCRSHSQIIEVPIEPVVQEHERLLGDVHDPSFRKVGKNVMAEKVAGSGIFYRAFVKGSKPDRVLLYFPADGNDSCVLEWVYKVSSRIYRSSGSSKWKYQGNGAWILVEKSKKAKKSVKRTKSATGQLTGCDNGAQVEASPDSDRCHLDDNPAKPSDSSSSYEERFATCVRTPWDPSPISRWFSRHLSMRGRSEAHVEELWMDPLRRAESTPEDHRTPDTSFGDEYCNSSHEEVILSGDSADIRMQGCHVRLSCTGAADEPRGNESLCELRFGERDLEDDGSNSDAAHHQSPSSSGCMANAMGASYTAQHFIDPGVQPHGGDARSHIDEFRNDSFHAVRDTTPGETPGGGQVAHQGTRTYVLPESGSLCSDGVHESDHLVKG